MDRITNRMFSLSYFFGITTTTTTMTITATIDLPLNYDSPLSHDSSPVYSFISRVCGGGQATNFLLLLIVGLDHYKLKVNFQ